MSQEKASPVNESWSRFSGAAAFAFAGVAGYVDAYALIQFQVYASFMSGNTTRGGVEAASGRFAVAALSLLAIVCFVLGAFIGVTLLHSLNRRAGRTVALIATGLLAAQAVLDAVSPLAWLSVALLCVSMGALNATITQIGGQAVNIGYVSGGLHKLAEHLALAWLRLPVDAAEGPHDTHLRRAVLIGGLWAVFLAGAFLGTLAQYYCPRWVLAFPIATLIVAVIFPARGSHTA
ncbi:YoaK family protein [Lacipirellula sp.]|uniref:YoaK family protein n=1 Tax=Lacipirellula sp. TaxID=2691419 RepID=UPI003D152875